MHRAITLFLRLYLREPSRVVVDLQDLMHTPPRYTRRRGRKRLMWHGCERRGCITRQGRYVLSCGNGSHHPARESPVSWWAAKHGDSGGIVPRKRRTVGDCMDGKRDAPSENPTRPLGASRRSVNTEDGLAHCCWLVRANRDCSSREGGRKWL